MIKVFSVAQMVAAEKAADAAGVSYDQMMETAGRGVAEAVMARQAVARKQVLVLVGPGNNGGDGLVAARYLSEAGAEVVVYLYRWREPDRDHHFARILEMRLDVVEAAYDPGYQLLRSHVARSRILIDSLLGTGVARPIGGELAQLMGQVKAGIAAHPTGQSGNERPFLTSVAQVGGDPQRHSAGDSLYRVAVDCPSGLNCDSGALDPLAFPAQLTVTFAGPKRGHFLFPGAAACGELVVADIDIPAELPEVAEVKLALADAAAAKRLLPQRPADGHKGTFGTALIAAGSSHYWGAPVLAARAAYRTGAGLVALAVPEKIRPTTAAQLSEATYPPVPDQEILGAASARVLLETVKAKSLLVGPGLGEAAEFLEALLAAGEQDGLPPLVVDADGLNLLSRMKDWPQRLPPNTILTPHPGEMARLMGIPLSDLKGEDRLELAAMQASDWGHVLLLKGAYTVIADPNGSAHILPFANPALGTAGSGDVLAGVIVALLAQGLGAYEAAVLGGYLHGAAGALASRSVGDAGLLAGEISDQIPAVRRRLLAS